MKNMKPLTVEELQKTHLRLRQALQDGRFINSERIDQFHVEKADELDDRKMEKISRALDESYIRAQELDEMLQELDRLFDRMIGYQLRVNIKEEDK